MQGQASHFARFAPDRIEYATNRYVNETRRLYKARAPFPHMAMQCQGSSPAQAALHGAQGLCRQVTCSMPGTPHALLWLPRTVCSAHLVMYKGLGFAPAHA